MQGTYIRLFLANELQDLIGPFQNSPLYIIPKPGKPGKFCLIQNFSFPHAPNMHFQSPLINSHIDVDNFPTTWGKFGMVYQLITMLPPGSEAYQMVPLNPSQWPAGVVCASKDQLYIDMCMAFGATLSAGAYGHVADAGAEIFPHQGIGPLDKWVDDYIFFHIRCEYLKQFNKTRKEWYQVFAKDGMCQSDGHLWFGGISPVTGQLEERNEDCLQPLLDLSGSSPRSVHDRQFSCCIQDIDALSHEAGIIWEPVKDQLFLPSILYIGFIWNIEQKLVYLNSQKVNKYLIAIHKWRKRCRYHNLARH